jgi:hypothetical protein
MSDHDSDEQDLLEAALRKLTPAPPTFGKDRLVFLAGQASGRRARWRLALLAAFVGVGTGIVGTYLGVHIFMPPEAPPQVIVIHVPAPPPAPEEPRKQQEPQPSPPLADWSQSSVWEAFFQLRTPVNGYLQMRDQALRRGVEAMPNDAPSTAAGPAPRPTTVLEMRSEMVGKASEF